MSPDLPPGIRRLPNGRYQSYVWRQDPTHKNGGYQPSKRWPPDASLTEMQAWRTEQELRGKRPELFADPDTLSSTFAEDAQRYLDRPAVRAMPTYKERAKHIHEWVNIFGRRQRSSIQPHEIQQALDQIPRAASSVNNRRTALMHLWSTLDGRHQANPVKATLKAQEPAPIPRAPELVAVLQLLREFPATTDYGRKCRARLKVITWTGWPHAIVKSLDKADRVHWLKGRAFVKGRGKGRGSRARWLPLLPQAKRALEEFHEANAYKDFSNSSLYRRVKNACKTLELPMIRPYDLRHFFGTLIATVTQDERAVMELMLLNTPQMVRRYTEAATHPRVQAAVARVVQQLPGLLKDAQHVAERGRVSRQSTSAGVRRRPRRRRKTLRKSRKAA